MRAELTCRTSELRCARYNQSSCAGRSFLWCCWPRSRSSPRSAAAPSRDNDEAFYAESAREMVESGDWLTPHFNYEPRFQKPVLYYWLTAATSSRDRPDANSPRASGRRWRASGSCWSPRRAGGAGSTSPPACSPARSPPPTSAISRSRAWRCPTCRSRFFITLAIWAAFVATLERERHPRRWLLLAAAAAALGFLIKGPLARHHAGAGRRADPADRTAIVQPPVCGRAARGRPVSASSRSPWYVAMWMRHGTRVPRGLLRRRQLRALRDRRASTIRGRGGSICRSLAGGLLAVDAACAGVAGPGGPVPDAAARRRHRRPAAAVVGGAAARLLHAVGRQAAALHPAGAAAAGAAAGQLDHRADQRLAQPRRVARAAAPQSLLVRHSDACWRGLFLLALAFLLYRAQPLFLNVPDSTTLVVATCHRRLPAPLVVLVSLTRAWRVGSGRAGAGRGRSTFAALPYGALPPADASSRRAKWPRLVRERAAAGMKRSAPTGCSCAISCSTPGLKHTDSDSRRAHEDWLAKNRRALMVMPAARRPIAWNVTTRLRLRASGGALALLRRWRFACACCSGPIATATSKRCPRSRPAADDRNPRFRVVAGVRGLRGSSCRLRRFARFRASDSEAMQNP